MSPELVRSATNPRTCHSLSEPAGDLAGVGRGLTLGVRGATPRSLQRAPAVPLGDTSHAPHGGSPARFPSRNENSDSSVTVGWTPALGKCPALSGCSDVP